MIQKVSLMLILSTSIWFFVNGCAPIEVTEPITKEKTLQDILLDTIKEIELPSQIIEPRKNVVVLNVTTGNQYLPGANNASIAGFTLPDLCDFFEDHVTEELCRKGVKVYDRDHHILRVLIEESGVNYGIFEWSNLDSLSGSKYQKEIEWCGRCIPVEETDEVIEFKTDLESADRIFSYRLLQILVEKLDIDLEKGIELDDNSVQLQVALLFHCAYTDTKTGKINWSGEISGETLITYDRTDYYKLKVKSQLTECSHTHIDANGVLRTPLVPRKPKANRIATKTAQKRKTSSSATSLFTSGTGFKSSSPDIPRGAGVIYSAYGLGFPSIPMDSDYIDDYSGIGFTISSHFYENADSSPLTLGYLSLSTELSGYDESSFDQKMAFISYDYLYNLLEIAPLKANLSASLPSNINIEDFNLNVGLGLSYLPHWNSDDSNWDLFTWNMCFGAGYRMQDWSFGMQYVSRNHLLGDWEDFKLKMFTLSIGYLF